jgi:hypothetical protein
MKYKVKKGTSAMLHYGGEGYDLRAEFVTRETDKDVTFVDSDVWFKPADFSNSTRMPERLPFMLNGRQLAKDAYNHLVTNYYGFRIPKNNLNIDLIIVKKSEVTAFEEAPKDIMVKPGDNEDFPIESDRQLWRRINRESGDYHFPGHLTK